MPDDVSALGFTNLWYKLALQTAQSFIISKDINIQLVQALYFLATKFEAFKGRGNSDLLSSRDIEDIVNVIDARAELLGELRDTAPDVKKLFSQAICSTA